MFTKILYRIPSTPAVFDGYQAVFATSCLTNAATWNLPTDLLPAIEAMRSKWDAAYMSAANRNTSSPAVTAARNALLSEYRSLVDRVMHDHIVGNSEVSEADRTTLGIHLRNDNRVPAAAPTTIPVLQIDNSHVCAHRIVFHDSDTPHTRKRAESAAYCELWYKVGAPIPLSPEEADGRASITKSGQRVAFSLEERDKYVYYFARWVNHKGQPGPWSQLARAIVI